MKILDIPQSGKRGLNVSQAGQFGQISRTLAIPANPRTSAQMSVRDNLSRVAARWRALTEPASRERSPSRAINFDACYLAGFADHARLATRKQQKKGK